MLKKIAFGFLWFFIIGICAYVLLEGLAGGMAKVNDPYMAKEIEDNQQLKVAGLVSILITIVFSVFATVKGVLPGTNLVEDKEIDRIEKIKKIRWVMLFSLAAVYATNLFYTFEKTYILNSLNTVFLILNMIFITILATKLFRKYWVTLLCAGLSFIPVLNVLTCIYLGVKANEIIRYFDKHK